VSFRRTRSSGASGLHQRGFALIAMLVLAALMAAFLISIGLNRSSAELSNEREDRNMTALKQAKAALIAYAASSEQYQRYQTPSTYFQPGALPCPDKDNDDGSSDCTGSTANSMIGRFPWGTLGVDDLHDASGERLWYALSQTFRKQKCPAANCTTINSDTQGQLTITDAATGAILASNVVAVVIAPGLAIQGQTRDSTPTSGVHNSAANYVESFSPGDLVHYSFAMTTLPTVSNNDRLIFITQADLMAAVEPVVTARIERDLKPALTTYWNQWSQAFPFPSKFNNPDPGTNGTSTTRAQSAYLGTPIDNPGPPAVPMVRGLLPITGAVTYPWSGGSVAKWGGTGGITVTVTPTCTPVAGPPISGLQCSFSADDGGSGSINNLSFQIQAQVGPNAGASLAVLPDQSNVVFTMNPCAGSCLLSAATLFGTLNATGVGTVNFQATLPISCVGCGTYDITVTIPDVTVSPSTSIAGPAGWFITNEWFRQTYYAVAPDLLPGGNGNCVSNPPCLTVGKLPPNFAVINDKQAILILAGRALNGTSRPSASFVDYLENANLNAAQSVTPYVYENRAGVPTSINDRVVVLSP